MLIITTVVQLRSAAILLDPIMNEYNKTQMQSGSVHGTSISQDLFYCVADYCCVVGAFREILILCEFPFVGSFGVSVFRRKCTCSPQSSSTDRPVVQLDTAGRFFLDKREN